jgi:hypothetical protein
MSDVLPHFGHWLADRIEHFRQGRVDAAARGYASAVHIGALID